MLRGRRLYPPAGGASSSWSVWLVPGGVGEPLVSVVVPTYNERENLPRLVERLHQVLSGKGISYEIVVVDDDSPDGTWRVALELAERGYPVRVVRRRGERGLGTAIMRGLLEARGRYIVVMDADLQHPPEAVPRLLEEAMGSGAELVVASRYAPGGGVAGWSRWRLLVSRVAGFLAHLLLPESRRTSDPMSGFFLVTRGLVERVKERRPGSWKVLLELLVEARSVSEVPYVFQPRAAGESKLGPREMLDYLLHLLRLSGWRPLRFALVGATGAVVNLATVELAYGEAGLPYQVSLLLGFEAGLTWNYVLHDNWTFRGLRPPGARSLVSYWLRYHAASAAGLAAYLAVASLLHALGVGPLASAALGIAAGFLANYTLSSLGVWAPRGLEGEPGRRETRVSHEGTIK